MTKEMQLLIKLNAVSKELGSSEGTRESIRDGIEQFLTWFHSENNALNAAPVIHTAEDGSRYHYVSGQKLWIVDDGGP